MDKEKYVDESWKESTAEEKEKLKTTKAAEEKPSEQVQPEQTQKEEPEQAADNHTEEEHVHSHECNHDHDQEPQQASDIQINFVSYISSLGYQAMIFLGEIPNPVTNEKDKNLDQAKFLIDTLSMLKDKTKGNLDQQEENLLNATVYELQMKFIEIDKKEEEKDG